MKKIVVILYGPPGSGKTTQARILALRTGLFYFDTGRFLESVVYNPARRSDPVIRRERKNFETGKLMTPSFVLQEVKREAQKIARIGWGMVFSGSPRTLFEAKGLLPILEKLYGQKNMFVFLLEIPQVISLRRNSRRLICRVCESPLLVEYYPVKRPRHCPVCGGSFYRRTLDTAKVISVRLKEYQTRTVPIFALMRQRGYHLRRLDGQPPPAKIFSRLYGAIQNAGAN